MSLSSCLQLASGRRFANWFSSVLASQPSWFRFWSLTYPDADGGFLLRLHMVVKSYFGICSETKPLVTVSSVNTVFSSRGIQIVALKARGESEALRVWWRGCSAGFRLICLPLRFESGNDLPLPVAFLLLSFPVIDSRQCDMSRNQVRLLTDRL